jgi:hypothetical protein
VGPTWIRIILLKFFGDLEFEMSVTSAWNFIQCALSTKSIPSPLFPLGCSTHHLCNKPSLTYSGTNSTLRSYYSLDWSRYKYYLPFMNTKAHYLIHKRLPLDCLLTQTKPLQKLLLYLFKMHFSTFSTSKSTSLNRPFLVGLLTTILLTFLISAWVLCTAPSLI